MTGVLDQVDMQRGQNVFTIYPTTHQFVTLRLPSGATARIVEAIGHYVHVYGQLKYKRRDSHPYEMLVQRIEVYPPEEELPTLEDLHGIAPDATGGCRAKSLYGTLRNEW